MAEKELCSIRLSTWAKIINMALGALMVFYSVMTFFTSALKLGDVSYVIGVTFKAY